MINADQTSTGNLQACVSLEVSGEVKFVTGIIAWASLLGLSNLNFACAGIINLPSTKLPDQAYDEAISELDLSPPLGLLVSFLFLVVQPVLIRHFEPACIPAEVPHFPSGGPKLLPMLPCTATCSLAADCKPASVREPGGEQDQLICRYQCCYGWLQITTGNNLETR